MDTTTKSVPRKKKSEPLTKDELAQLKKYRNGFHTGVDCAEAIGIDVRVMDRVILVGSGAPETIEKIRTAIGGTINEATK